MTAVERLTLALYTPLLRAVTPVLAPFYLARGWRTGKYLPLLRERLGWDASAPPLPPGSLWIHAVSVGEVLAARTLAGGLRSATPRPLVLSATTAAGVTLARAAAASGEVDGVLASPLDFPGAVARVFARVRPAALVLVEAELWPNWLRAARHLGVPVVLVNARISARSFTRWRRARWLFRPLFAGLAAAGARTDEDAARLEALGVAPSRLRVTGDLKFDVTAPMLGRAEARARFGVPDDAFVFVAGSLHEGEEAAVVAAFRALRMVLPDAVLVLAPRKSFTLPEALAGFAIARRSRGEAAVAGGVLFVDTMGELRDLYAAADLAFVGGSLVPAGGHNLLEPAAASVPVLFGPSTETFAAVAAELVERGGGFRVADAGELSAHSSSLAADESARREAGQRGAEVVAGGRGALARTLALLAETV